MDRDFTFRLAPADLSLTPQLSRTLVQRSELRSREAYPRLWDLTDRLNDRASASSPLSKGHRLFQGLFSLVCFLLGLFLLIPFAVEPENLLVPGITGAIATVVGAVFLWYYSKLTLGILSLGLGAVLTLGAVLNVQELGRLLPIGAALLALGFAALFVRKRPSTTKFDKAAKQLIDSRNALPQDQPVLVTFSDDGINSPEALLSPYANLDGVFESEDLYLVELAGKFLLLQKKELIRGTPSEFSAFIRKKLK